MLAVSFYDIFATLSPTPAMWGSNDHTNDGLNTPEAPVVGQLIATPGSISGFSTPMPASSMAGSVLLGLVLVPRLFQKRKSANS